MFGFSSTVLLALALAQPPGPPGRQADASRPKLIVKERAYFLHALPPANAGQPRLFQHTPAPAAFGSTTIYGLVILHTSTATAEMKILAAGGTTVDGFWARWRNYPRPDIYQTRIAGVAADRQRIYVLRWHSSPDKAPSMQLVVFRPDTGEQVHSLDLKGKAVPKKEPEETANKGPLQLHANGVTCFGTRFEFKGTRLIKQSKQIKRE
jgi:hypothetical protein